jgi:OOP family OmpA-OmpF porin
MRIWRALAGVLMLAIPLGAHAQPVAGPYISLGAGVGFQQNEIQLANPPFGAGYNTRWSFDPGFSGQGSVGYGFGNGLRAEIEGDFLSNTVRRFGPAFPPRRAGGSEEKYGGMANVLYDFRLGLPVFPYLGLGVGGQVVTQHDFNQSTPGFVFPPGGGSHATGAFAYQAIAGLAFPVPAVSGLSFTVEYRFLGSDYSNAGFPRASYTEGPAGPVLVGRYKAQFVNDFNHSILLGLRYALFHPAPPPPPAPVVTPVPAPARTYLVFFDWDRADLSDRARQIIAEAAEASRHVQYTRIEVNGYTDRSGTPQYNVRLSIRRANNVAAELVRDGVPRNAIDIHGFGETHPLVPTAPGVREPQNRRVEIILR